MFTPELMIAPDERVFIAQAEAIFARVVSQSIQERGIFSAALSGGSTPKPLYQRLASSKLTRRCCLESRPSFLGRRKTRSRKPP